jgi:hypothetical protein
LDSQKVAGDVKDLTNGLAYVGPKRIYSAEYSDCSDADLNLIVRALRFTKSNRVSFSFCAAPAVITIKSASEQSEYYGTSF